MAGRKKASTKELPIREWPQIGLRVHPDLLEEFENFCEETGRGKQDALRWAIKRLIAEHDKATR